MRKVAALTVLVSLLVASANAEEWKCSGRVVNESGESVAGAAVKLYRLRNSGGQWEMRELDRTVCDADGRFDLSGGTAYRSPDWPDLLIASGEGAAVGWVNRFWGDCSEAAIVLGKPIGISGRVIDTRGNPVVGASIRSLAETYVDGERQVFFGIAGAAELTATSDGEGRFFIPAAPEGSAFDFVVSASGYGTIATWPPYWSLRKGTVWLFDLPSMACKAGGNPVTIVLPVEAGVEGAVLEKETGRPVAGLRIALEYMWEEQSGRTEAPWQRREAVTDEEGRFALLGMAPGQYRLVTLPDADDSAAYIAPDTVTTLNEGSRRNLIMRAERAARVKARITDAETGAPLEGVGVWLSGAHTGLRSTDRDGTAMLFVPPGSYTGLRVGRSPGYYVPRLRLTGTLAAGRSYEMDLPARRLSDIGGRVLDEEGHPVPGARVRLLPYILPHGRTPDAVTGEDGRFAISTENFPFTHESNLAWLVARIEERNLVAAVKVDNFARPYELNLREGTVIDGQVVDENGKGVPDVPVSLGCDLDIMTGMTDLVYTDEGGRYEARALPPCYEWRIFARRAYWIDVPGHRALLAEGERRHSAPTIVMPAADKVITGRVTDAAGNPLPGVDVQIGHSRAFSDGAGGFRLDSCTGLKQILRASAWVKDLEEFIEVAAPGEGVEIALRPRERSDVREREPESLLGRKLPDLAPFGLEIPEGKRLVVMLFDKNSRVSRHWVERLDDIAGDLAKKDVAVLLIDISGEGQDAAKKWAADEKISLPVGAASGDINEVRYGWGIGGVPWIIVVQPNLRVNAECVALQDLDARLAEIGGQ